MTDTTNPPTNRQPLPAQVEDPLDVEPYRVRVWPSRRWGLIGPAGWRMQVDHLGNYAHQGDRRLLARPLWFPTADEALNAGVAFARDEHGDVPDGFEPYPCVVAAGTTILHDDRWTA